MQRRIAVLGFAAVLAAAAPVVAQEDDPWSAVGSPRGVDTLALAAHTQFLASDLLEGRGTGTPGERVAAAYIVSQLRRLDLAGAEADGGYRQPLPLREAHVDEAETELVVQRGGDTVRFRTGRDFIPSTAGRGALRDFAGAGLFAGTSGFAADALADAGDLDGRVIVVYGTLGREAVELVPDWTERGAEGVVLLAPDPASYVRYRDARGPTRLVLDAAVDNPIWQPELPVVVAAPTLGRALLEGSGLAPDALNGERPFTALSLDRRIDVHIGVRFRELESANVAAVLPGADPERRDEFVVYTAHYDHLGIGAPDAAGDSVYNGFSDNAAGVAMLLGIAEALRASPPARSVLFLFFTGEERGLLGSSYYVTDPVVPLERTVAVINLDAGAPPAPPASWHVAGGGRSELGEWAGAVAESLGLAATPSAASPNSDHWPFLNAGIPAVFLIPGQDWDGVSEAEAHVLHRRWDRYHQASDEWSEEFPFAGLRRYARFALALGRDIADAPARPRMREAPAERP